VLIGSAASADQKKETLMTARASGSFDVKISQQGEPSKAEGIALGRMLLDKQYHGDLEATAHGEMLTVMTDVKGSAVYVAVERVTGSLGGRRGSFAMAHKGTMARGAQELTIIVVPDSGSGELSGLSGSMKIEIVEGKHFYEFEYAFSPTP
jgi:hypothetical protein